MTQAERILKLQATIDRQEKTLNEYADVIYAQAQRIAELASPITTTFHGSHDISHCNGEDCPKANTCQRYLAHLQIQENPDLYKDGRFTYIFSQSCVSQDFSLFWGKPSN